ncbi:MAG: hypothetical protein RR290_01780 [Clostridia bacterium]
MKKILEKLRDPILLSSIISTIFLVLSSLNIIKIPDQTINTIISFIMTILSILGILNTKNK